MKKTFIFLILLILLSNIGIYAIVPETKQRVHSPNGDYEFFFYQKQDPDGSKQMYYTLNYKGKDVIAESKLGVLIENQLFESALAVPNDTCEVWGENLIFSSAETSTHQSEWKPVYGEYEKIQNHYNELIVKFRKGDADQPQYISDGHDKTKGYFMDVIVRAYNEGVAIRYHFPEPSNGLFLHIVGEQTEFTMPEDTKAYYEGWAQGPYSLLPLSNWKGQSERPLTMVLPNGLTVALTEAQMTDFARMKLGLSADKPNTLKARLYGSVDVIPAYSTPWRVIMAAEKPTELITNNTIILNLNPENVIKDVSWIQPGKVTRITQLNHADAVKHIDFAAERGLQYVHLDAGWYGPEMRMSSSALTVSESRDIDMPALISYAAQKNIGVWVYVNQRALFQELDSILPLYKKWGIKGIKFGFVQVGNQYWTNWLHDAVRKCAEYGIMVNIHDEYRPTGFSRTYPNLMTQEGIKGNEEFPDANHNTILPFTRFLAGPADYTICYFDSRIKNTHAHQLALAVIYYSPIQYLYWYDNPSRYNGEQEVEFFDKVKTVWDDTRVIDGEIGEFISIARRSENDWFVGAITNKEKREISIKLDFLDRDKKYVAHIYTDDVKINTKTKVKITRLIVNSKNNLSFKLNNSGGCAIHFEPANIADLKLYRNYKKGLSF